MLIGTATWASIWPPARTNPAWHNCSSAVTTVHETYALPAPARWGSGCRTGSLPHCPGRGYRHHWPHL